MPVQIDGEPWMQPPGHVIVRPILTQVLLRKLCDDLEKITGGVSIESYKGQETFVIRSYCNLIAVMMLFGDHPENPI